MLNLHIAETGLELVIFLLQFPLNSLCSLELKVLWPLPLVPYPSASTPVLGSYAHLLVASMIPTFLGPLTL